MDDEDLVRGVDRARTRFLDRVADLRPDLHRYCARMTGSVIEGEDVVQEALARAFFALPQLERPPPLRPWLFRIAHNVAIDRLRSAHHKRTSGLDQVPEPTTDADDPEDALARAEATEMAIGRFLELPATQRSCVILKDVLGYSLTEAAEALELTVPAVKAALHRGRVALRGSEAPAVPVATRSEELARYVALFNARDWDGVRALLAEEVRLDLVSRSLRSGREEVGAYFSNYDKVHDWKLVVARVEGIEVAAVVGPDGSPRYFVELRFEGGRLARIRDWRYTPWVVRDADLQLNSGASTVRS